MSPGAPHRAFLRFFTKIPAAFCAKALDSRRDLWYNVNCKVKRFTNSAGKDGSALAKNLEISFLLDFYGDVLTERQRDVMEQYYNDDLSLAEIADNFGITRQGVRDAIKRGEGIILELEQKVGFAARYRAVQQGLAQIESLARDIRFANANSYSPSAEIERSADRLLAEIQRITD